MVLGSGGGGWHICKQNLPKFLFLQVLPNCQILFVTRFNCFVSLFSGFYAFLPPPFLALSFFLFHFLIQAHSVCSSVPSSFHPPISPSLPPPLSLFLICIFNIQELLALIVGLMVVTVVDPLLEFSMDIVLIVI